MKRRNFIKWGVHLPAFTLLPATTLLAGNNQTNAANRLLPSRLKPGANIGLIAPGYAVSEEKLAEAKTFLEEMGFTWYHTDRILGNHGYLSNTDAERLADLHHMFSNPEVDAILCVRGGYGCTRLLPNIEWDLIAQNPKIIAGFSDVTALLVAINQRSGLVCFHAPVGTTLDTEFNREHFLSVLGGYEEGLVLQPYTYEEEELQESPEFAPYTLNKGIAEGEFTGGNLSLLSAMTGTPFEPDYTGKIVFIEEIEEEPYRVDRMLTQLRQSATFDKAKAVVLGIFAGCNNARNPLSFNLKEVITDKLGDLEIPIGYGFPIGHIDENITIPLGTRVQVNTETLEITLLESATV